MWCQTWQYSKHTSHSAVCTNTSSCVRVHVHAQHHLFSGTPKWQQMSVALQFWSCAVTRVCVSLCRILLSFEIHSEQLPSCEENDSNMGSLWISNIPLFFSMVHLEAVKQVVWYLTRKALFKVKMCQILNQDSRYGYSESAWLIAGESESNSSFNLFFFLFFTFCKWGFPC